MGQPFLIDNMYNNITEYEIVEYIKKIVLLYLDSPEEFYTKKSRKPEVLKVKQYACYFSKKHTSLSNQNIADLFGLKTHSSIISLMKKIEGYATYDRLTKHELKEINEVIKLKGLSKSNRIDFEKYYYINMNNFKSVREAPERAIIFIGYDDAEIINLLSDTANIKTHLHTKKFLIEENPKTK
jgi:hypothetical protein